MKKVILGAFLLTGVVTFAQEKTTKTTTTKTVAKEQPAKPTAKEATSVTLGTTEAHDHAKPAPPASPSRNTSVKATENKAATKTETITTKKEKALQPEAKTTK